MPLDRSYLNQCLAKAIAYKQCGKDDKAAEWAKLLVIELELTEILA